MEEVVGSIPIRSTEEAPHNSETYAASLETGRSCFGAHFAFFRTEVTLHFRGQVCGDLSRLLRCRAGLPQLAVNRLNLRHHTLRHDLPVYIGCGWGSLRLTRAPTFS